MSRPDECLSFELISEYVSVKIKKIKKITQNAPLSPGVTKKR